jgi:hypothetical protein
VEEVGRIIGTTSLRKFLFAVTKEGERHARKDDFVSAIEPITGREVIGLIREVTASNQLLPDEFARESAMADFVTDYALNEGEYIVGIVDVLGHLNGESLEMPKYSLRPATPVSMTKDETIKELLRIPEELAVPIGTVETRPNVPVSLDANKLVGTHCAILAMTGAGKSYTGGVLIEELLKKGGAIVVFDPHGEYKHLGYRSDGSKSGIFDKVNVLGVGKNAEKKLKIKAGRLTAEDIAAMAAGTTDTQRDMLYEVISICQEKRQDYNLKDMIEILHMILERKGGQDNGEEVTGSDLDARIDKLVKKAHISTTSALLRRLEGLQRSGLISESETPLKELVAAGRVTVIDLSGLSESIKEIVVAALARKIFYARMNYMNEYGDERLGLPCFLVLEEAHNFVPREFEKEIVSRGILRRIAREGRKFGVGLCLISQRPSRLDQDVLSQCNTQIIMKIVNPLDQDFIRKSAEAVTEDVIRDLPGLGRGEAIISGSAIRFPMRVKIKKRDTKPGGGDIDIIGEWKKGLG